MKLLSYEIAQVRRFAERMVGPHRTMLHGLRPRAFRSANVLSSQASTPAAVERRSHIGNSYGQILALA